MSLVSFRLPSRFFYLVIISVFLITANLQVTHAKSDDLFFDNLLLAGNIFLKAGSIDDAIMEFEKAEEFSFKNADVLIGLVRAYARKGDFDLAYEKLTRFVKYHPNDMRVHLIRGEYMSLKGHTEEAANEFYILVEKGIYRFEALQGLIHLYAQTLDENIITVIETSIPLYEPSNQAILYNLLAECLEDTIYSDQAKSYMQISSSLTETDQTARPGGDDLEPDPIECTITKVQVLMLQGNYQEAERILSEATREWPGEPRIQELLKSCYMGIVEDTPIAQEDVTTGNIMGLGSMVTGKSSDKMSLEDLLPQDVQISWQAEDYLTEIVGISTKTEDYFNEIMKNFQALQSRIWTNLSDSKACNSREAERNLKELEILIDEAAKVCRMEIDVLEDLVPPESFAEFHDYLIETTEMLYDMFKRINTFVKTGNWAEYYIVVEELKNIESRVPGTEKKLAEALQKEISAGTKY